MTKKNIEKLLRESLSGKKVVNQDARKRWERLRHVVLSDTGTTSCTSDVAIQELTVQQQDIKKRKRQLKLMFEKSIEDAEKILAKAELKTEHTNTSHKKEVTNMKRKVIISEHSKIIEKVFEDVRQDVNRKISIDRVASSLRLVRKMEAHHDRLRARKLRLKEMAKEKMKTEKNKQGEDGLGEQEMTPDDKGGRMMDKDKEELIWKAHNSNLEQGINKENEKNHGRRMLDSLERMQEPKRDENDNGSGNMNNAESHTNKINIRLTSATERQGYGHVTKGAERLPSLFEIEDQNENKAGGALAEIFQVHKWEQIQPNVTKLSEGTLPMVSQLSNKSSNDKLNSRKFARNNEHSLKYKFCQTKDRKTRNTVGSMNKGNVGDIDDFSQNEIKNRTRPGKSLVTVSQMQGESFPNLVKKQDNTKANGSSLTRERSNAMQGPYETAMQPSSEKRRTYRFRDTSYSESTRSSFTINSLDWASSHNNRRSADEIYRALFDAGLENDAEELQKSLTTITDEQQELQDKLQEVQRAHQNEIEKRKRKKKEQLRIKKMKLAYHEYKKKEKERREREELQQKLKEEAEKRIQKYRKLYREMVLLAMENSLSRNYNFSYFMGIKPKIEEDVG